MTRVQGAVEAEASTATIRDIVVNGVRLRVEEEGSGRETIVFSHGMLRSRRMFDAQVAALRTRYRCVRYDHRGQGDSETPPDDVIALETVYDDAVALLEHLGVAPCHWVGLSMGGMVGMRIAARRPELLLSLTLLETTGERDTSAAHLQGLLSLAVLRVLGPRLGAKAVIGPTAARFYSETFRHDPARRDDFAAERASMEDAIRTTSPAVVRGVLGRPPVVAELSRIRTPTLVVVGEQDTATPPEMARRLAAAVPGARLEFVAGAGHTSVVEQPEAVSKLIDGFLAGVRQQ